MTTTEQKYQPDVVISRTAELLNDVLTEGPPMEGQYYPAHLAGIVGSLVLAAIPLLDAEDRPALVAALVGATSNRALPAGFTDLYEIRGLLEETAKTLKSVIH